MFNDTTFRVALAISFSVHFLIIATESFFCTKAFENKNPEIEITYLIPETAKNETQEEIMESLPKKYDLRQKDPLQVVEKSEIALEEDATKELEEYIQYYELVREKIKKHVMRNYTNFQEGGIVEVVFTINQNGALINLTIDDTKSTGNRFLRRTALESVKDASPFPAFPDSLAKEKLAFNLSIIFKNNP